MAMAGSHVTQKTKLRLTWQLVAGEVSHSCEVHLLCHNATRRGVHPPKHWKNKLNLGVGLQAVASFADSAVRRARDEFALSSDSVKLDCRPLVTHARTLVGGRDGCMCLYVWCTRALVSLCISIRIPRAQRLTRANRR